MHSPTVFAALLDADEGGRFVLRPTGRFDVERRYVDRTNVLETTYTTRDGVVRVTDALTMRGGGQVPWRELARRIEGLSGAVELEWGVDVRPDWGRADVRVRRVRDVPVFEGAGLEVGVHAWGVGEADVTGRFTVRDGDRALIALAATSEQPIPMPRREEIEARL